MLVRSIKAWIAKQTIGRFYKYWTADDVLEDFSESLLQLGEVEYLDGIFDKFAVLDVKTCVRVWTSECFAAYLGERYCAEDLSGHYDILWRFLVAAQHYPFDHRARANRVNHAGFRRACALLFLRGFDLVGDREDSAACHVAPSEGSGSQRVYELVLNVCSGPAAEGAAQSGHVDEKDYSRIYNVLRFIGMPPRQSRTQETELSDIEIEIERTTVRLARTYARIESALDLSALQSMFELLLICFPVPVRCVKGLYTATEPTRQRSGDVQHAELDIRHMTHALIVAKALFAAELPKGDHCSEEQFLEWCRGHPSFGLLFFQLWEAVFSALLFGISDPRCLLPMPVVNALLLCNAAQFVSPNANNYRWHQDELRVQCDLRLCGTPKHAFHPWSSEALLNTLDDATTRVHLLLLAGTDSSGQNCTVMLFVSALEEVSLLVQQDGYLPQHEADYSWMKPIVQLLPIHRRVTADPLRFVTVASSSKLTAETEYGDKVFLDLDQQQLSIRFVQDTAGTLDCRLTSMGCYRLFPWRGTQFGAHLTMELFMSTQRGDSGRPYMVL